MYIYVSSSIQLLYLWWCYELMNRDVIVAQLFFWRGMYNVNAFTAYQRSTGLTLNVGKHPRALAHCTGGIPFRTRATGL